MHRLIAKLFPRSPKKPDDKESDQKFVKAIDPLDPLERSGGWKNAPPNPIQRDISSFQLAEVESRTAVGDGATTNMRVGDSAGSETVGAKMQSQYTVPEQLQNWYLSQSFIGYQACAIIAQHWLVDKACSMAGEDAIRNGWEIKSVGEEDILSKEDHDRLRACDVPFKLKANLAELERFKNIFGIRVAIFHVESDDPDYYEKPFNVDGITEGSYKGISQIDPYWMMPMMTAETTADPANIHFYDPEFWVISGRKYHRSHLIISRGPIPADILKPTYIFGGIPMTQRIYERVYAAERTANEAPLLALNKRTTAIHVDVEKALANQSKFEEKLAFWIKYRDNHGVKVLGKEETIEQFDTSLSDFDSVIMNQYQLVAAIAKVPATKILGTSPKGFNATGDFETISYHEELESIQEHQMSPMAERHYLILGRSLGIQTKIQVIFEPVDSLSAKEQAELNKQKSDTDKNNIDMGAVSPDEVRDRIRNDKDSGYNHLTDEEAEEKPGMSPENLAAFEKAGAEQQKGQAALQGAGAAPQDEDAAGAANPRPIGQAPMAPNTPNPSLKLREPGIISPDIEGADLKSLLKTLAERMSVIEESLIPNGQGIDYDTSPAPNRTSKPSVRGSSAPSVPGAGALIPRMSAAKLPKMKMSGMIIVVENPKGTIRAGTNLDGTAWSNIMPNHYGFIKGVTGADGDELDCFVGPNMASERVFVINQNDPATGEFDEHKCMLGFDSPEAASEGYHAAYAHDWEGFGSMEELPMDGFKSWIKSAAGLTQPITGQAFIGDKEDFKESDHPRAKNGQFGSGGAGGSSSAAKAAPAKPSASAAAKPGSKKDALPALAKSMTEKSGKSPTPSEFHEAAIAAGFEIIPAQSVKYLKMFLSEQKKGGAEQPKKESPKIVEVKKDHKESSKDYAKKNGAPSTESFVSEKANSAGYKSEGTYNGIQYYKAPNGDKVSYKADSDTWASISGGKITDHGSGIESLHTHFIHNKAKPAAPGTMAASPVSASHTATTTAKKYGATIPEDKFSFSSKGIANEKALPEKVQAAIKAYKGSSYHEINNAMRFSESFDPDTVSSKTMAHILNLQRAFAAVAPSQKEATVGRKIGIEGLKSMAKDAGLSDLKDLKSGMVLSDPGIVSTSHSKGVWGGDVNFEIKLPKGSKAIDISETITLNQGEQEVILGPNSKLKIHEVKQDHKPSGHSKEYKYHIVCELVQ